MVRRGLMAGVAAALVGCATPNTLITRPPGGYEAIRFTRPVVIDQGITLFAWRAGNVLVNDRQTEDGRPMWCGPAASGRYVVDVCALREGGRLSIRQGAFTVTGDLPPDAYEMVRQ